VEKARLIDDELRRIETTRKNGETLLQMLRRPEVSYRMLPGCNERLSPDVIEQVEIATKYAGYIQRQEMEVNRYKSFEEKMIPSAFDYSSVPSLRMEARLKLAKIRPSTIGQASRISGVSPADISILLVWLKRQASVGLESRKTESVKEIDSDE
jgi:tRNA uridine 5-carboxymethylaminomethyl modification enzyme